MGKGEIIMIVLKRLVQEIRKLAKENPDAIYEKTGANLGCFYTKGKINNCITAKSGCIVGQALVRIESRLSDLLSKIDELCDVISMNTSYTILNQLFDCENSSLSDWIITVQKQQDQGCNWKSCILSADEEHPIVKDTTSIEEV
jgi:hypothetical protein